jgi:hypothetical protein
MWRCAGAWPHTCRRFDALCASRLSGRLRRITERAVTEWWTYRLSDFLMFSAPTYYRLFERHNAALWPWQWPAIALGSALAAWLTWLITRQRTAQERAGPEHRAARVVCGVLAAIWCAVAWSFLLRLYAPVNWAATGFAIGFGLQALGLLAAALGWHGRLAVARGRPARVGLGLLLFALWVQPVVGRLFGRPWAQAEVFALVPDPTVLATLGLLLTLRRVAQRGTGPAFAEPLWWLWPLPLLWCVISGATLWTLDAPDAALMPVAAAVALFAAWRSSLQRPR